MFVKTALDSDLQTGLASPDVQRWPKLIPQMSCMSGFQLTTARWEKHLQYCKKQGARGNIAVQMTRRDYQLLFSKWK